MRSSSRWRRSGTVRPTRHSASDSSASIPMTAAKTAAASGACDAAAAEGRPVSEPPAGRARDWRLLTVLVCALGIDAAWLGVLELGDLKQQVGAFALLFFGAFVAYLGACRTLLAAEPPDAARAAGRRLDGASLALVLGMALLFRATLLAAAPTLSNDLNRYVWEGKVLAAGWSPYHYPPDAPELEPLRDDVWAGVNNRRVPSPYPPLAQGFGLLAYHLFPERLLGPKLLATLGDLAALGVVLLLLRQARLPLGRAVVYAWNPLVVLAFAHSGHNDAWMIALLLLACWLAGARRFSASAAALALATLAKVLPLLAVPLFATVWGRRPWPLVTYAGVLALGYAPVVLLDNEASGSLFAYTLTWTGNESLFFLLRWGLAALGLPGLTLAKLLSLLAILAGVLALAALPALRARPLWWRVYAALALALVWASTL